MQPYQLASEKEKERGELPIRALKSAATIGLGSAGVGAGITAGKKVLERAGAFLNQYIPEEYAMKGLSKIDPRFGNFINKALNSGKTFDDVKEFINEKIGNVQKKNVPNQKNIIAQYDDNLHSFLENEIKNGRAPLEAAAVARTKKEFNKSINQIEKDHKTNWSSIIESIYGTPQEPLQSQQTQQQPQGQDSGNQALMALADKILNM